MSQPTTTGSPPPVLPVIAEVGRELRAPWAASIAGILFAILFTGALVLLRTQAMISADDQELIELFATGGDTPALIGGLYLAPFAGIMFLWFIAVIRDQIGEREDRFFATVFFGSGLIFVALLFASVAVASAPILGARYLGQGAPTAAEMEVYRAIAYTVMFGFATRAAAVFMIVTATVGVKSGTFPRWFAWVGYLLGLVLLLVVSVLDWAVLVLPGWVAVVSLFILKRERARRVAPTA